MTKKVCIGILVSILLSLFTSFCFAATNTDKVNLGNNVSSSINKSMNSVGNAVRDVVDDAGGAIRNAGDAIGNVVDNNNNNMNNKNGINNNRNNNANNDYNTSAYNNRNYNNGIYGTTRTSVDNATTATGMSTTAWMWVIFAIADVIIIAAIWYYAMQGNDRD